MNALVVATNLADRCRALAAPLAIGFACCACSSDKTRWDSGEYVELKDYTSVEFRRGPMRIDPGSGELTITWVGARTPEGHPRILECRLYVFDDRNGNRARDAGEVIQELWSHELCRKVMFGNVHVQLAEATGTLMAEIEVNTEARHRAVSWKLLSP